MNEATLGLVMMILGVVAFLLVEGYKAIAKWTGKELDSALKLKVTLVVSFIVGTLAAISSGELDIVPLIEAVKSLPSEPLQLLNSLFVLVKQLATFAGSIAAIGQAVYALLKGKMEKGGWLSFALEQ